MAYRMIRVKFLNTCVFPSNTYVARDQLKKFCRNMSHLLQSLYRSDRANMLDIFLQVKSYLVLDSINVDNAVFRLHYKVTFLILVCCSIILSARQYLDDTIACLSAAKIPQVAMNAYWEVRINV